MGPGHFRDVHQPLNAWLKLHKGSVVREADDTPRHPGPDGVLARDVGPRIRTLLLEAQGDTARFTIVLQNVHFNLVAHGAHL